MLSLMRTISINGRLLSLGPWIQPGREGHSGCRSILDKSTPIGRQLCNSSRVCSTRIYTPMVKFASIVHITLPSFAEQMESHDRHRLSSDFDSISPGRSEPRITSKPISCPPICKRQGPIPSKSQINSRAILENSLIYVMISKYYVLINQSDTFNITL
jgi:hypothetical protein